jgi:FkbM family methyltransferase
MRNFIHDLSAPLRVRLQGPIEFKGVLFAFFANGLGTFRTISENEPRSVDFACKLQGLGISKFLDIGSSFGVWSLPFMFSSKEAGRTVSVMAVDAHGLSCSHLHKNAVENNLAGDKLIILNSAVGLSNGYAELFFPKYASNMGSINQKNKTRRLFNQNFAVPMIDILELVSFYAPDLVKIDIEGLDLAVASKICQSLNLPKVLSVEVTPTNISNSGMAYLATVALAYPFLIPITKESENNTSKIEIVELSELIQICNATRKTNVFFFRDLDIAEKALRLLNG